MSQNPPKVCGRYRLERELVAEEALRRWAAVDTVTDEPVEIVAPRAHILLRPGAREIFDTVSIDHPSALPVLARLEVDGTPMRVRPMTQGTLVGAHLSPEEALALARWVIPGIQAGAGCFGGELRPEDIVIDASGIPRLAPIRLPRVESLARVPLHRAPELLEVRHAEEPASSVAADLFGLGVVLYRAVSGAEPYPAESVTQLRMRTLNAPPLSDHLPVPPELDALVNQLIALDPAERSPIEIAGPAAPPTLVLARDHDAPSAVRGMPRVASTTAPGWLVLAPLANVSPAMLLRVAIRSGVSPEAVARAAERGHEWVIEEAETQAEATRLARRHQNRGLPVRVQETTAPRAAQYLLLAVVAALFWFFLPMPISLLPIAAAMLMLVLTVRGLRQGVVVARARLALADRQRAPAARSAEGRAWAMDHRLRENDEIPATLRADLREAVDAVVERLEALAVAEAAAAPAPAGSTDAADFQAERERLCRQLTRLEVELTHASTELSAGPESPRVVALGKLARELRGTA